LQDYDNIELAFSKSMREEKGWTTKNTNNQLPKVLFARDEIVNLDNGTSMKKTSDVVLEHQNHIEEQYVC
jgi:hypothetical protein